MLRRELDGPLGPVSGRVPLLPKAVQDRGEVGRIITSCAVANCSAAPSARRLIARACSGKPLSSSVHARALRRIHLDIRGVRE